MSDSVFKEIAYISSITRTTPRDLIILPDRLVILVKKGDLARTVGKNGRNIHQIQKDIGKTIIVVEYSSDLNIFLKNFLRPIKPKAINLANGTLRLELGSDKKFKFGRKKVELLTLLLKRHYDVTDVKVNFS